MSKVLSGSPVPRQSVFILADGSFVVQWDTSRVQELLSGRYRAYDPGDFGHTITDYELNQLKAAGRVEHYNRQYVWLFALPEAGRFEYESNPNEHQQNRVRSYYLNTTLPKSELPAIEQTLKSLELENDFLARNRGDLVAILGKNGAPFRQLNDAERAQKLLISRSPEMFRHTAIAFIETTDNSYKRVTEQTTETPDLAMIIASQTDTSVTQGKRAVLVMSDDEERHAIGDLVTAMKMDARTAATGVEGLQLVEDVQPDVLIMDLQLTDMHGWEMVAKIKEIDRLKYLPIIVIANHSSSADNQAFALTVVKVDVYLVKPISMAQLRQNIWMTLKNKRPVS